MIDCSDCYKNSKTRLGRKAPPLSIVASIKAFRNPVIPCTKALAAASSSAARVAVTRCTARSTYMRGKVATLYRVMYRCSVMYRCTA